MRSLSALLSTLLLAISANCAFAQGAAQYPDRPVRIIVPLAAGGLADISIRLAATRLSELLGKPVLVENLPGAGNIPAANAVLRSKPDGHTLIVLSSGMSTAPSLFKSLPYDPVKDFAHIAFVTRFDLIVLASGEGRYKTLADLVAAAKAQPGKLNIATVSPGSIQHLSAELFKSAAGMDAAIVPFKTSPEATAALLGNRVDAVIESFTATRALVEGGKLRTLASTGAKRSSYLPNVPTAAEAGVANYEVIGWIGLAAPAGTPSDIVMLLNRHVNAVVGSPEFAKRMQELGNDAYGGTPEEFRARVAADVAKWAAAVKQAGLVPQ
jgi:tripartite-type tricarboxylate transporter receptor subunit TctC